MLAIVVGYLIGSIPFSYILPKFLRGVDVRKVGTGNVGGSNAIRNAGVIVGSIAGTLDFLKGLFAAILISKLANNPTTINFALLMIVVGHCFPIFLSFHGGRGIAPALGILLYIDQRLFGLFVTISIAGIILKEAAFGTFLGIVMLLPAAKLLHVESFGAIILITIFLLFRRVTFVWQDLKEGKPLFLSIINRLLFDAPTKKKYEMILRR